MKILFVENKHQTHFWAEIAAKLKQDGHEISWIVQNTGFTPNLGFAHTIPYPTGNGHGRVIYDDPEILRIASTDRGINYFGGNAAHYDYYEKKISDILNAVQPEVVFGEATLFHELLCIRQCRARNILYLNPSSCRYPAGRFSFYLYDTPTPFGGSSEQFGKTEAESIIDRIAKREVRPDYMNGSGQRRLQSAYNIVLKNLHVTACRLSGERYNTPSPVTKILLEHNLRRNRLRWEKLTSSSLLKHGDFRILYPLQMQPESNIDLWGNGYRNQTKLLVELLRATNKDTLVVVKPNPKSKYELSDNLIELARSSDRFVPISHKLSMTDALEAIDLIVTVTGTVAIEAIFAERPVVTLVETLHNTVPSCVYVNDLARVSDAILMVREGTFPKASAVDKVALLNLLTSKSYRGVISNPFSAPSCVHEDNIRDVHSGFQHVLRENPEIWNGSSATTIAI